MLQDLTIVIPTYNRNDFLIKILNTIPKDLNVVIGDNGGDVTDEIIDAYQNFSFIRSPGKLNMYENWNFCIGHVKTKWFIIPSDDDLFYPDTFHKVRSALRNYDDASIIIFGHDVINENDEILSTWSKADITVLEKPHGYQYFKYGVEARLPSIVFNTKIARSHGLFDESYVYTAADSLLIQKCMLYGNAIILPDVISAYRVWSENFTSRFISTADWLAKVDKWQDEILLHVKTIYGSLNIKINTTQIKDEVYAYNLISGILNKKVKSGRKGALAFFRSVRFPWRANFLTKLRVIKALFVK